MACQWIHYKGIEVIVCEYKYKTPDQIIELLEDYMGEIRSTSHAVYAIQDFTNASVNDKVFNRINEVLDSKILNEKVKSSVMIGGGGIKGYYLDIFKEMVHYTVYKAESVNQALELLYQLYLDTKKG